jgi:small membrane protein
MIIQVFLTALLLGVATLVAVQRTTSRLVQLAVLAVIAVGGYFVWAPEQANVLAEAVGVGRGADLLFYLWVVITLALILFMYLKIQRLSRRLTSITRAVALAHPKLPDDEVDRP